MYSIFFKGIVYLPGCFIYVAVLIYYICDALVYEYNEPPTPTPKLEEQV